MHSSVDFPHTKAPGWVYATLTVMDGNRRLNPTQVSFDHVLFLEPPCLQSEVIEIILVNGDAEQHQTATVLPHDPQATWIPIRLIPTE